MHLQIFGLSTEPGWWHLNRIPTGGGAELSQVLRDKICEAGGLNFFCGHELLDTYSHEDLTKLWSNGLGQIVAKPLETRQPHRFATPLRLVTTSGPDSGRVFPLTRRKLSVGRASARAQVRDPQISSHDFDIRLTSNGTLLTPMGQSPRVWESGESFVAGSTEFELQRGPGTPLPIPSDPGRFEIAPGQPPSPPNLVLQIIGAAAPLLIGVVLMLVTGMWYFLLFSGISVIIAAVLITQYRRARKRFVTEIRIALDQAALRFRNSAFAPHELTGALTSRVRDPLSLVGQPPDHPIVNFGTSVRQADIFQVHDTRQWDAFLYHRVSSILRLHPGRRTLVVGDPGRRRPVKNWIIAQVLRHTTATHTGMTVDGLHFGGPKVIEITAQTMPQPDPELHQIIFVDDTEASADKQTTIIDLDKSTIEGPYTARVLEPFGISAATLELFKKELLLDQPPGDSQIEHLSLADNPLQGSAVHQMVTTLGVGPLGLNLDLVSDGPHMLITGTTGSGKSELLLTVLLGLAQRYPPCEVSLVLLDFKGGSSFNVFAPLPHTMSVETNHIAASSFRSLEAIAAELYRREALFAQHDVADFDAFRRASPNLPLPRLVVAIDELRVLIDQNSDAATTLAHLAATGRSLGFHLIIATQRTQGAVNADIRANIGCTIALRTATEHDSWDVLGTADAFHISPMTPGRAYFKAGAGAPHVFQTARYMLDDEPVVLLPHDQYDPAELPVTTDWPRVVQELRHRASDLPLPEPIILPALPQHTDVQSLREQFGMNTAQVPVGLVDAPAQCRQYAVALGAGTSAPDLVLLSTSVAWIGGVDSGIEECIRVVLDHVVLSSHHRVLLEGRQLSNGPSGWDQRLEIGANTADTLQQFFDGLIAKLSAGIPMTIVITEWGSWATALVSGSFHGFEERLMQLMRQFASVLTVYVFGARELAGGRLLAMIPDRFYIPKNSSAEHQIIWPTLISVPPIAARGVMVTSDHATGGLAVQLCTA